VSAGAWRQMIADGQREALRTYGHLSRAELLILGSTGKLRREVVELLVAARDHTWAARQGEDV